LDERRVRLEHGLDPSSGHPTLRAHADIQRAELDAWLADLGEFACQCWAFGDENAKVVETADVEDSEDEEDDEEEEDDDGEDNTGPSTSKPLKKMPATVRSDTARIRLACKSSKFNHWFGSFMAIIWQWDVRWGILYTTIRLSHQKVIE